ncbi:hypothetical protein BKA70DRAFT_1257534 [Coprinopsis sp. MPI-PUGE-AT-0042]|nr:hypothetical protein BKA70DRAFT_1257534 [Coprinopsis sp. MPI-PUGE-AT-0042]
MDTLIHPRQVPIEVQNQIRNAIRDLPVVGKAEVDVEEMCPICLTPFSSLFAEAIEESGCMNDLTSPPGGYSEEESLVFGLTRIEVCGHIFCRRDLVEWISGFHGSCPTCRQPFLDITLPSESDDESSDGGEYVPTAEDFEDDDDTLEMSDAFSEMESADVELNLEDYLRGQAAEIEGDSDEDPAGPDLPNLGSEDAPSQQSTVEEDWLVAEDDFHPQLHAQMEFSDTETETDDGDNNPYLYALSEIAGSDDEMDDDYIPMEEDVSDTDSEPSFSFTDGDSEDMSSEVDDLSLEEMYPGLFPDAEDRVSVQDPEDELDLPDHEKGLSSLGSDSGSGSKAFSTGSRS